MPPAFFVTASPGTFADPVITLPVPTSAKVGDALLAIVSTSTVSPTAVLTSSDFALLTRLEPGVSSRGQIWILRRIIDGTEGPNLAASITGHPGKLCAATFLYRGLDPGAAIVASAISNVVASINFICPALVAQHYSDMLLAIAHVEAAVVVTPFAGTTERYDAAGTGGCELEVAELLREQTGTTGTKIATTAGAQNGLAASVLLQAGPTPGTDKVIRYTTPGAIGLPIEGI